MYADQSIEKMTYDQMENHIREVWVWANLINEQDNLPEAAFWIARILGERAEFLKQAYYSAFANERKIA